MSDLLSGTKVPPLTWGASLSSALDHGGACGHPHMSIQSPGTHGEWQVQGQQDVISEPSPEAGA